MKHSVIVLLVVILYFTYNNAFKIQPKISRGHEAAPGQFPFYVFLEVNLSMYGLIRGCGATIISDQWLVTVAHCLANSDDLTTYFGIWHLNQFSQFEHKTMKITSDYYYIHENFIQRMKLNDIALIRLPNKIQFSKYIQPVNMPTTCEISENIDVVTMGNGAISDNDTQGSDNLLFATLQTISWDECCKTYPFFTLRDSIICAQNRKSLQSVCNGDSGSALITKSNGTLIGITAFSSPGGCESGLAQGFTSIYYYMKWIKNVTGLDLPDC